MKQNTTSEPESAGIIHIILATTMIIIVVAVGVALAIHKHVRPMDEHIIHPTTGYELISDTETTGSVHFLQNGLYLLGTDAHLNSGKSTLQKLSTNTNAASKWQTDKSRALQCFMEYAKHNNLRIIETTPVYSVHRLNIETGLLVLTEPIDSSNTD